MFWIWSVQDWKAICEICPVPAGMWSIFIYINAIAFRIWTQLQLQSFQQKSKLARSWRYDRILGLITGLYKQTHNTTYSSVNKLKVSPRNKIVTQDRTRHKDPVEIPKKTALEENMIKDGKLFYCKVLFLNLEEKRSHQVRAYTGNTIH